MDKCRIKIVSAIFVKGAAEYSIKTVFYILNKTSLFGTDPFEIIPRFFFY